MKRARAAGLIGVAVLTMALAALAAPAAQAGTQERSTSCAVGAMLKFRPGLVDGSNPNAFFTLRVMLRDCTGGVVATGSARGGGIGNLTCTSGEVSGKASAKAEVFWDTGDSSGLNFFINFDRAVVNGKVVDGLFKGERVTSKGFSMVPATGDCATSPLDRSRLKGTLAL